jgi:hypothetical protein
MHTDKTTKLRWTKTQWIALSVVAMVALVFIVYSGMQTVLRWSNPQLDMTANYFEKSVNAAAVYVGALWRLRFVLAGRAGLFPSFHVKCKL